jgi:CRISPR-associated protein Csm1
MSLQVFLQAQLLGIEEFLATPARGNQDGTAELTSNVTAHNGPHPPYALFGRCAWLTLFCEVLPRALLAELKLSRMLLGSSSAEQFLLVLAEEDIPKADEFLARAAKAVAELSANALRLVWASTENLGAWPVARKRLDDALLAARSAPLSGAQDVQQFFAPFTGTAGENDESYFSSFGQNLVGAARVGWTAETPAHLVWDGGQHWWALKDDSGSDDDAILFPRRFAMDERGNQPSSPAELAQRAEGSPHWGILRGDVDQFDAQLRRAGSIEEHIHLSVLFKEFFAGELSLLCTMPGFWRKVSILYRGGDDFAVIGSWDALVALARELQRLFEKLMEHNSPALPSLEEKTITMALAIAAETEISAAEVFREAGQQLAVAKASEPGTFHAFGHMLEWKRLSEAEELKTSLVRLVRDFGYAPEYILDLTSVYRESASARGSRRNKAVRIEKPWRTYMRVSSVIPQGRGKEVNNVRAAVITNLAGKRTAGLKLRPSARVGLEWARLAAG